MSPRHRPPTGSASERPATHPSGSGLRERRKAQTRRTIQEHALRLFLSKGYDATTVAEIASAADVSHMTFFRYFPSKEAVVESDDYDPLLVGLIENRPSEEGPLSALRNAVADGLSRIYATDRDALLARTRLILHTPALRARMGTNLVATEDLFAAALAARLHSDVTLEIRVIAAAALATLTTALTAWVDGDGVEDLPSLVDDAFDVLTHLSAEG